MKLGCASWGFRKLDVEDYLRTISELGLKFAEVECFNETAIPGKHIPSYITERDIVSLREKADSLGVKIVSFAGGNDFTVQDKSLISKDISRIKKMIDLAKAGEVEIIRLFAGWIEEDKITDSTYKQVINSFKEVGEYAQDKGIILALENHGGITATPEQIKRLLDGVNLSSVGFNYDPANFHHCKVNSVKALEMLKNYIVYVHLKDSQFENGKHEYKAVGDGEIKWASILNWLNTSYTGYAMIEYEDTADVIEGTKRSLNFINQKGVI